MMTAPILALAPQATTPPDPWVELRRHTPARIALGRAGTSLPTTELLRFAAAQAQARDAVQVLLDVAALAVALRPQGWATLAVHSRAGDREAYLQRPDRGRRLDAASAELLSRQALPISPGSPGQPRVVIVVGDGLSALAAQRHAPALLAALRPALIPTCALAPLVIAEQARVALADEIGALLGADLALILLGERPGLSAPHSLGAYLTFRPQIGNTDAQRNCVSNIRPDGLTPQQAALRLAWLLHEALRRQVSGVALKDDSGSALLAQAPPRGLI